MAVKQSRRLRVLLASEDVATRAAIGGVLESAGYGVAAVSDRQRALDALVAAVWVDAAVIDCSAPAAGNAALAAELSLAGIRVVALITPDSGTRVDDATASAPITVLAREHWSARLLPALQSILARGDELAALRARNEQLEQALAQGREVNVVVGILMERFQLARARAFDLLRGEARSRRVRLEALAGSLLGAEERLHSLSATGAAPMQLRV